MKELTFNEIILILLSLQTALIAVLFYRKTREIRRQQKTYQVFALRDYFVRLYYQNEVPKDVFLRLIQLTNNAVVVGDHIDLTHTYSALKDTEKVVTSKTSKDIANIAKENLLFAKRVDELLDYIIKRSIKNSMLRLHKVISYVLAYEKRRNHAFVSLKNIKNFKASFGRNHVRQSA